MAVHSSTHSWTTLERLLYLHTLSYPWKQKSRKVEQGKNLSTVLSSMQEQDVNLKWKPITEVLRK